MTPAARERLQVRSPLLLVTAAAWMFLALTPVGISPHVHNSATMNMPMAHESLASLAGGWLLMLAAMMAPMLIAPVRHIRDNSFARRRVRAIALFVAAYGAVWMVAGCFLLALAWAVRMTGPDSLLSVALVTIFAAVWQISPFKQVCLNRCHAHPELAAFGSAADFAVLRFGWTHAVWCVGSCWAMMLLPLVVTRGHLALMAAVSLWLITERFDRPLPPLWAWRGPVTFARVVVAQTRLLLLRT